MILKFAVRVPIRSHLFDRHFNLGNAWTISNLSNNGRSVINGNFTGELDISTHDTSDITNRVDLLEREVKGRDADIRGINDRVIVLSKVSICLR